ncbi:MAG TPA: DUF1926 domain-containing protein [Rhodocyclaceae bacterium]|nr:DUF1926 domain-containing protein [Rhodocyclaceae bacterium]
MKIDLLLGVHAHQPVGNFESVMVEAHERCYKPFIETLYRFPSFRFSAHFSGWLLSWLMERFPRDMALLREMVARGQVEMFGSGDCEPVLAAIATRDRITQIEVLSKKLQAHFVRPPTGAWLTERVWESTVVASLADTGIRYVAVDDYHFLCTGLPSDALDGHYTTEEDGRRLDLFPISEALRYRVPFAPAHEVVAHLESLADAGHRGAVYFDDIEKFGIWPETYDWVYIRGWLEQFIEGVLASPKIRTSTYADFHASNATRGIVYLPTTSYIEMNEWTLPAPAAATYSQLLEREKHAGRFEQVKPFTRGGIWRNFLSRYPESNWMHKRVQSASERLSRVPAAPADLTELLHRAQANDAYWHGLFGGLYLPHLRRAIWNNLLQLEAELDRLAPRPGLLRADVDLDGVDELLLNSGSLQAAMRLDGNAALHELSFYPLRQNFGDTLRRRREHYHQRIEQNEQTAHDGEGIRSAHDRVDFKHPISESDLETDRRPRASFLDAWQASGTAEPRPLDTYALLGADGTLREATLRCTAGELVCDKSIGVSDNTLTVRYACGGSVGTMQTALNIAMPSCDGYSGRYVLEDGSVPGGFGQLLVLDDARGLTLDDRWMGGSIRITASRPVEIEAAPFHTVSLSEAGFEKIMQGVALYLRWAVDKPGNRTEIRLSFHADS